MGEGGRKVKGGGGTTQLPLLTRPPPLPALKATQTELLELRRKYDEEAASK